LSEGYLRIFYVHHLYWLFKLNRAVRSLIAMVNNFLGLEGRLRILIRSCVVVMLILQAGLSFSQGQISTPEMIKIPAGDFLSGSEREERDKAYSLDEVAYGHSVTRTQRWYESEHKLQARRLPQFSIMKTPVTRCEYAQFLADTDHPSPQIDQATWDVQRLKHSYKSTLKFQWKRGEQDTLDRCQHPVVLVSHKDAITYANWLSVKSGRTWRLPNEFEWEKAARGIDANLFPWGNRYDPSKLNSHDKGPFDTLPVGTFSKGASPFGMFDAAGQVFEWTSTGDTQGQRFIVKGGSWDDKGCGVCRPAARHYRPKALKHILVGFRLVTD